MNGLVYAEVPFKQPPHQQLDTLLNLDDTHVEYAHLNHNQLANTCNPPQTESQLGLPQKSNGMILVIMIYVYWYMRVIPLIICLMCR